MPVIGLFYFLFVLLLAGCRPASEPVIGEGFVAPATLNLRKELGPRQPSVATVRHGERVEILAKRRRFFKVRAASGSIGWIDGEMLFSPRQMQELRKLGERAAKIPSHGEATVLGTLNVHTHPDRDAPSFHQIQEEEHVTVVGHRLVEASQRRDDWSLVRISPVQAGWVLTRMLFMSIPDEVAQYAEGHRITSYFPLGEVRDGDTVKRNWLWTTITKGREPYQFDSWRVFVWSQRRHRYETATIERKLKGYFPVEVRTEPGVAPSFSLIVEDSKTGELQRRTYAFQGFHVRMVARQPWIPPVSPTTEGPDVDAKSPAHTEAGNSFLERALQRLAGWRRRFLGR